MKLLTVDGAQGIHPNDTGVTQAEEHVTEVVADLADLVANKNIVRLEGASVPASGVHLDER